MEFWLKENSKNTFMFPVAPSEFGVSNASKIETVNINNLGEVALFSGNSLSGMEFSSFFPGKKYSFVLEKNHKKPYECVSKIEAWRKAGTVLRFIVTGTNINDLVIVENFDHSEVDGTRDVFFSISLKEYKELKINTEKTPKKNPGKNKPRPPEPNPKPKPKKHKVVKGDTLWGLSKKYYYKKSKYTIREGINLLAKANKIKNPNRIYVGQVLVIP